MTKSMKLSFKDRLDLFLSGRVDEFGQSLIRDCHPDSVYVELLANDTGEGPAIKTRNSVLDRYEVIKICAMEDMAAVDRFFRGAQILSTIIKRGKTQMEHLPFPEVYDATKVHPHIRMEYVNGCDLRSYIEKENERLNLQDRLQLFIKVCKGLTLLHEYGVVHRDVKPANVLLDSVGNPYWIDFGIAKSAYDSPLTLASQTLGTPAYASPEQINDAGSTDHRSDIFSLGKLLYFLVTGQENFNPANLPPELVMVFSRAVQRDRERRFSSVSEFVSCVCDMFPEWNLNGDGVEVHANIPVVEAFKDLMSIYKFNVGRVKRLCGLSVKDWESLTMMASTIARNRE